MSHLRRAQWWYLGGTIAAVVLVVAGFVGARTLYSSPASSTNPGNSPPTALNPAARVEAVFPTKGGLSRRTSQPGSAHSFESAELYAKISGYLKAQHVDIGSRVKQGDLLAEIDAPELTEDVEAATAACQQASAEIAQAEARVESAIADQKAAHSRAVQSKADVERFQAEVGFGQKQYDRIKELNGLKGIEDRLVDEKLFQLQAAQANHRAAESAVVAFEQLAAAAESRIRLAKADLQVAKAKALVFESQLDRAKVMVSYTQITSPYDGVVTCRNFHRGAFVRSPVQGGQIPLLSVDRTDLMRVQVRIPEREVPYIQPGDRVTVRFDALPQREFSVPVSRIAESEDSATRSMLAEIDLPNPDHEIRDHMYGRVEIALDEAIQGVTIPSTCLVGDVANGQGQVFVIEGSRAKLRKVQVGRDTGIQVEILSGLVTNDAVVLRPSGGLTDGAEVASGASGAAQAIAHK
jgi:HlyD family secretion protein